MFYGEIIQPGVNYKYLELQDRFNRTDAEKYIVKILQQALKFTELPLSHFGVVFIVK